MEDLEELAVLKKMPVSGVDRDLFQRVREVPAWKVWMAVFRRPFKLGILLGFCAGVLTLAWNWSEPLSYSLTVRGADRVISVEDPMFFFRGMVVSPQEGQTTEMQISGGAGFVSVEGNSSLIVQRAGIRSISGVHWLMFELPRGTTSVSFSESLPHECRIMTPQALIRLIGTRVQVQALGGITRVNVFDGSAEVKSVFSGERAAVHAGSMAEIGSGEILTRKIVEEEKETAEDSSSGPKKINSSLWYEVKP